MTQPKALRISSVTRLTSLAALAVATAAHAGSPVDKAIVSPSPTVPTFEYSLMSDYVGKGSFEGRGGAEGDALGTGFESAYRLPLGNSWPAQESGGWYFRMGATYKRFDFGQSGDLPLPAHLQSVGARLAIEYFVNDKPAIVLEVVPSMNFEDEIDAGAFQVSGLAYASIPVTSSFIATVGVLGSSNGRNPILPAIGFIWTPAPQWTVFAIMPRPRIIYSATPDLDLWAGGELVGGVFRTDGGNGRGASLQNAIITYQDRRAGAGLTYRGWKPVAVELGAGYSFNRKFDYYRAEKGYLIDEGAPYVQLKVSAAF